MALGSAAPEIIVNMVSTIKSTSNTQATDLGGVPDRPSTPSS